MKHLGYLVIAASLAAACAQAGRSAGPGRDVLTREEISKVAGAPSLYDVIARLRREFLVDRGRTTLIANAEQRAVVFLNGIEYGHLESLKTIQPDVVEEVRYFNSTSAVSRFGSRFGAGVIEVRTRQQ